MPVDALTPENLIASLNRYSLIGRCFDAYLRWVCKYDPDRLREYDLVTQIEADDHNQLSQLESLLNKALEILKVDTDEFVRKFGFTDDLLTADPEKVHDILAEPLFVIDLEEHGFSEIEKLPQAITINNSRIPIADFAAFRSGRRFAIELKTIRTESWAEEGKPLGDATKPAWWLKMFYSNAETKIEDKNRHVITQLKNTCKHFNCQAIVLALYTRRLGPSTLMQPEDYREQLKVLRNLYPVFDYLACKNYFADVVVFEPKL